MRKNILKSVRPNEFVLVEQGFSGIRGDIEDELLPYGFSADIKNLVIDKEQGMLKSVPKPKEMNSIKDAPIWSSNTEFYYGQIILPVTSNGHFYICVNSGTSGVTEPTWPTTVGATVDDYAGATTWAASTAYAVDDLVLPTVSNGRYYQCITAGTSDTTEPVWPINEGDTVTDGTVVWVCHNIATWKEAGLITDTINNVFLWEKDDGSKILLIQIGDRAVCDVTNFKGHIFASNVVSFVSGMLDKMYVMNLTDGLYSYDGITFTPISSAPKGRYITLWYNRLFVGGDLNDGTYAPYRIRWSNLNDFTTWDPNDFIDFRTPENSKITGLKPYKQALYVATASSISAVNINFNNYEVYKGDLAPKDNLITLLNGFFFVNDFGLYALTDSDVPIKIGAPFKKYWKATSPQSLVAFGDKIYYLADDSILVYDTSTKTYTRLVYGNESVLYSADHLYLGTTDGKVYALDIADVGYLDWSVKTKVYNFGFQSNKKRPKELYIYWKSSSTSSFDVNAYYDYATLPKHLGTVSYTPSGTIWGSFIWGDATWIAAQGDITESRMYIYENLIRTMQLEFYGSGEFELAGFNIIFKPYRRYGR